MFSAELDPKSARAFNKTLQRLADATDRPVEQVLRQQGRLLAKDLAFHIHPRGVSASIGRSFQQIIKARVRTHYKSIGWLHQQVKRVHGDDAANYIVRLIQFDGNHKKAEALVRGRLRPNTPNQIDIGPFDDGRLHRKFRFRKVSRPPILVVTNYDQTVNRYAKGQASSAGWAKGALINAGLQLDGKAPGIPKWIKGHRSSPGRGILRRLKNGFSGLLESRVSYARDALPLVEEIRALDVREETATKQLKRIVDSNIRKAMRGR